MRESQTALKLKKNPFKCGVVEYSMEPTSVPFTEIPFFCTFHAPQVESFLDVVVVATDLFFRKWKTTAGDN